MKYHCRCRHPLGMHVKSEKDDSILECTDHVCTCEEYEEQSNDNDVWPEEMSLKEHEHYDSLDTTEDIMEEEKTCKDFNRPPFVEKFSDDEVDEFK